VDFGSSTAGFEPSTMDFGSSTAGFGSSTMGFGSSTAGFGSSTMDFEPHLPAGRAGITQIYTEDGVIMKKTSFFSWIFGKVI